MTWTDRPFEPGLRVVARVRPEDEVVLTPAALAFVADLVRRFRPRVASLLARRREVQARYDAGQEPDFLRETVAIRESAWQVGPIPADLMDRRVEITGPPERKMIVNALNSGANVYMSDFEDSHAPTWRATIDGQRWLMEAVRGKLAFTDPTSGKRYAVGQNPAVLVVRPRGWHLVEGHVHEGDAPIPAGLFDFGLYLFHNARALLARGTGPYFYLPKMESHHEARLWNDVFVHAQRALGLPLGTIKATVLIETLPAAFEMDEILWELRDHVVGLNLGRWDYLFSVIKTLRAHKGWIIPDRSRVTMEQPFLRAYAQRLVQTCHKRGAFAMGGMAAYIPVKDDAEANRRALGEVERDKIREVRDGCDGTWVAHPGLVPVAKAVFDTHLDGPNQLHVKRDDVNVTRLDLLRVPEGPCTAEGLALAVRVSIRYLGAWLQGVGCVPIDQKMEDAATAEICRSQLWQWVHHGVVLEDGTPVDAALIRSAIQDEVHTLKQEGAPAIERYADAAVLLENLVLSDSFEPFLTLPAYDLLTKLEEA
jgi:malate synthase